MHRSLGNYLSQNRYFILEQTEVARDVQIERRHRKFESMREKDRRAID